MPIPRRNAGGSTPGVHNYQGCWLKSDHLADTVLHLSKTRLGNMSKTIADPARDAHRAVEPDRSFMQTRVRADTTEVSPWALGPEPWALHLGSQTALCVPR
jgi:hypothetical protein